MLSALVPHRLAPKVKIIHLKNLNAPSFSSSSILMKGPAYSPRVRQAKAGPRRTPFYPQKPDPAVGNESLGAKDIVHQGLELERVGKGSDALQLYERATNSYHGETYDRLLVQDPSQHENIAKVFLLLARARAKFGDWAGTEKAITAAALEHDDPTAYLILATDFRQSDMPDFEPYLLKAAASGIYLAAYELGILHLNTYRQGITSSRANALEWLSIGAEAGIPASQLYYAILLREVGRAAEGLEWLEKASISTKADEWTAAIKLTKKIWQHDTPNSLYSRIEEMRNGREGHRMGQARKSSHIARLTIFR